MPGIVLSTLWAFSPQQFYKVGTAIITILQLGKMKHREVNSLAHDKDTSSKRGAGGGVPAGSDSRSPAQVHILFFFFKVYTLFNANSVPSHAGE